RKLQGSNRPSSGMGRGSPRAADQTLPGGGMPCPGQSSLPVRGMSGCLYAANHPVSFWRPLLSPQPALARWDTAVRRAAAALPYKTRSAGDQIERLLEGPLREGQFGPDHRRLSPAPPVFYPLEPPLPPPPPVPSPPPP